MMAMMLGDGPNRERTIVRSRLGPLLYALGSVGYRDMGKSDTLP